jgi:hypothetical protein
VRGLHLFERHRRSRIAIGRRLLDGTIHVRLHDFEPGCDRISAALRRRIRQRGFGLG